LERRGNACVTGGGIADPPPGALDAAPAPLKHRPVRAGRELQS
jgi:hypothetical protein